MRKDVSDGDVMVTTEAKCINKVKDLTRAACVSRIQMVNIFLFYGILKTFNGVNTLHECDTVATTMANEIV